MNGNIRPHDEKPELKPQKSWQGEVAENICIMLTILGLAAGLIILIYIVRTT